VTRGRYYALGGAGRGALVSAPERPLAGPRPGRPGLPTLDRIEHGEEGGTATLNRSPGWPRFFSASRQGGAPSQPDSESEAAGWPGPGLPGTGTVRLGSLRSRRG
jgi:hypothetical protein